MNTLGYGYPGNGQGPDRIQFRIDTPAVKMKPCPFCGSQGEFSEFWYAIRCKGCKAMTRQCDDEFDAIEVWNRRVKE